MALYECTLQTPIGSLRLTASDEGLRRLDFPRDGRDEPRKFELRPERRNPILDQAERELAEYFAGTRHAFEVALEPMGTAFELRVWKTLGQIPYGETWTYGDLAEAVGNPRAARAVGAANGRNPLAIFVPCHRVIGKSGSLTGFGGGLTTKRYLLELEGVPLTISTSSSQQSAFEFHFQRAES